ncbi:peroxiredoxin family protein [Aureispira anguillae]|uniref:Redoxin domain-containing protein n=1 Tax=Aureispira anguillae TaxID=2864201 RepID=A0A915YFL5_9BACT|nr:redoxin domain-containing protein [Aureispira anguillae]BDS12135.1 redoxin domain-containing protein [Aureispira anguillae]
MKYFNWLIFVFLGIIISSVNACQEHTTRKITFEDIKDSSNRAIPTKIEENIIFYNTENQVISTEKFNQLLAEGLYLSEQKLNVDGSEEVHLISIKEYAQKLERQSIPDFEIVDLMGNIYTKENLLGKITVLSFWFTSSHLCTKDIQDLSPIAQKYTNNKNFLWLAPALDKSADLSRFLRGKNWKFSFAANQEHLSSQLGILTFPTHLIINKKGKIHKAVTRHPNSHEIIDKAIQQLL